MPNLHAHPHVAASAPFVGVAALAVDLVAAVTSNPLVPTEFRLLPLGRFKSADGSGRPHEVKDGWLLDHHGAHSIAALSVGRASRRVIDFEHQTLRAAENGKPAPAAGWFSRLEARADGLYAVDVEWTAQAAQMIADKQYRYISPVFPYDKRSGAVLGIAHAALTNDPGLDGLTDLAALAALANQFLTPPHPEEPPMKDLLKALGLPETATEVEALAALAALKTAAPDPASYVGIATLTAVQAEKATLASELAALKAERAEAAATAVIAAGLAAGKLTPATEPHARKLTADLAALSAFIDALPAVVVPGGTQTGGTAPAGSGTAALSAEQETAMKIGGWDKTVFAHVKE